MMMKSMAGFGRESPDGEFRGGSERRPNLERSVFKVRSSVWFGDFFCLGGQMQIKLGFGNARG